MVLGVRNCKNPASDFVGKPKTVKALRRISSDFVGKPKKTSEIVGFFFGRSVTVKTLRRISSENRKKRRKTKKNVGNRRIFFGIFLQILGQIHVLV